MGTITIYNGTNVPINSVVSSGFNYSWVNYLQPGEFYEHEAGALVCTLSTRYALGEDAEFHATNPADIGVWVGGMVIALGGLALAVVSFGTSIIATGPLVPIAVAGLVMGAAGVGVGGLGAVGSTISIAIKDFTNVSSAWTNIHAIQNRKFIARGIVEFTNEVKDGRNHVTWTKAPTIRLTEVGPDLPEWSKIEHKYTGYLDPNFVPVNVRAERFLNETTLAAKGLLSVAGGTRAPRKIFPFKVGGGASWEVENDDTAAGAPIQLWDRGDSGNAQWEIRRSPSPSPVEFNIYNPALDCYVTVDESSGERSSEKLRVKATRTAEIGSAFNLVQEYDRFLFKSRIQDRVLIAEDGGTGNSTKVVAVYPDKLKDNNWARWTLEDVSIPG